MFSSVWLYVTEACNLRCSYCFNPNKIFDRANTIDFEDYKIMLDNILLYREASGEKKPIQLVLFGGEPTLVPDLMHKIMQYTHEKTNGKFDPLLITNGTRISDIGDLILDLVKMYGMRIQISIDGDPSLPSDRTNNISVEYYQIHIKKAFDFLLKNSLHFNIRSTLTPKYIINYFHNFKYFVSLFEKNPKLKPRISFIPEFIHSIWTEDDYNKLEVEQCKIIEFCMEYYKEKNELIHDVFLFKSLIILKNKLFDKKTKPFYPIGFCGFSNDLSAISPTGDVYACQRVYETQSLNLGNLVEGSFNFDKAESIKSIFNNRTFIKPHPGTGLKDCSDCEIRYACQAVCPAECFFKEGELPNVTCNLVLYNFQLSFTRNVERIFNDILVESFFEKVIKK